MIPVGCKVSCAVDVDAELGTGSEQLIVAKVCRCLRTSNSIRACPWHNLLIPVLVPIGGRITFQ
jgi:hypothetical protein